jgi:tripartite-type tricarboxylate transporter receptor subunit TctC
MLLSVQAGFDPRVPLSMDGNGTVFRGSCGENSCIGESGDSWVGFIAPAGTPKDVVALLNREIVKAMALPDIQERLVAPGYDPVASTSEALGMQIKADIVTWAKVIRAANIKVQ